MKKPRTTPNPACQPFWRAKSAIGSRLCACLAAAGFAAAALPASGASLTLTTNAPTPGVDDVYSFNGADNDAANVNNGADGSTYVAYDQNSQGQVFTTGSSSAGYLLTDIWVEHNAYTNAAPGNGTWWDLGSGAVTTVRVTNPAKVGQTAFAISSETYTWTGTEDYGGLWSNAGVANQLGDGLWLHFKLSTPVSLSPNTRYGFDLTATVNGGGNYFELFGTSNSMSGGFAYSGTSVHTPSNTIQTNTGNRVFLVQLGHVVPAVAPALTSTLAYVPVGQTVHVTATIPTIANASSSVNLVLTNNNPSLLSLPGGVSKLTLSFAAGATNVQTFNVQVTGAGVGTLSVVTNAAFTLAAISLGTPVSATEEFAYDPSVQTTLDGANGGSGFGAAWSQPTLADTISSPGLAYAPDAAVLTTAGNAAAISGTGNEAYRALPGTYGGVGGGTVWISFLAQASSGLTQWGGVSLFTGTNTENLFLGEVYASSANNTWGFSQGGTYDMDFTGSITPGAQVDFLVYRIDFPATNGGPALVSFYADPTLNNTPPFSPIGSAYVANFTFDTLRLGGADSLIFDEVRIGSSWNNVMQFTGTPQTLVPPVPVLSTASRFAPVGYAAAITVTIPTNAPLPVNLTVTNDNPTAFSLSSSNAMATSLTFPAGGTNVQTLAVQVLSGGSANLTVVSNTTINTASITIGAQVSAVEAFQYPDGSELLSGSAGGSGFDVNTWSGAGSIITPGLTYQALWSASNAANLTAESATRTLFPVAGSYGGAGGGTVWISFLVRGVVPSTSASTAGLTLLSGSTQNLLLGLNTYAGNTTWGWLGIGQGPASFPNSVVPSTNVDLLVYRLDFPANSGDLVNVALYVDPPVGTTPPSPTGTGAVHYFTFDTIGITSTVNNDFDEIRLGGSWSDVVPGQKLNLQPGSGSHVTLSWPANAAGSVLQTSGSVTGPWVPASLTVSVQNGQRVVTDTTTGTNRFYRLANQ